MSSSFGSTFRESLGFHSGLVAGFFATVLTIPVVVVLVVAGLPLAAAIPLGLAVAAGLFVVGVSRMPEEWADVLRRRRLWVLVLWMLACVAIIVTLARMSAFMVDVDQRGFSLSPDEEFLVKHSHTSGYISAALIADHDAGNLYNTDRYDSPKADSVLPAVAPQDRDIYVYPPQFLLLPRLLLVISDDFPTLRALWFALYVALLLLAMLAIARWVGGREGAVLGVLTPAIWIALPVLATLQLGNIHIIVVLAASVGAMVLFERRRNALGGALLAFAVLSKISPAVFGIYLLVQRKWIPALWTTAWGAIYTLATYLVFGWGPLDAFLSNDTVQKLGSGEFQSFVFDEPAAIINNYSPYGIPYKLDLLGLDISDPAAYGRLLTNIYSLLVLGLVVVTAVRMRRRELSGTEGSRFRAEQLIVWLALITLASFRAPFGPWTYTAVGSIWLFAAFATTMRPAMRNVTLLTFAWFLVSFYGPDDPPEPLIIFTLVAQAVIYATAFAFALRASSAAGGEQLGPETTPATTPTARTAAA